MRPRALKPLAKSAGLAWFRVCTRVFTTVPTALPQPPDKQPPRRVSWWLVLAIAIAILAWLLIPVTGNKSLPTVDYSVFYGWAEAGKVSSVVVEGRRLTGELGSPETVDDRPIEKFQTTLPMEDEALLPMLREKAVRIRVSSDDQSWVAQLLVGVLPWILIIGIWLWLSRRTQRMMGPSGPLGGILKTKERKFESAGAQDVNFDDVAGLASAKQDLQEIILFLREPDRFRRLGGKVPRGVLLVGPPGTGKTLLARAVAGESGVPFYSISASEFIEMFVGVGAARVRDLFSEAKKNAPAIIFIDEIDAVGRARGAGLGGGHDEREQTLNQLLSELDGFDRNDLTIVLAATNRPDVLDPALLRPGRFDRRVIVGRPEVAARGAILRVHSKGKPLADDVDLEVVAKATPGFSGADLANLVNEAALGATRRGADEITSDDFTQARDKIVLGDPSEGRLDPAEKKRVAVHEAGHAIVAEYSPEAEGLRRVSIIPRGMALGVTEQMPEGDRHLMTRRQLEARLRVLMAGHVAEQLALGDVSSGAENDLKQATELATKMVAHFGMSEKLGPVYHEHHAEHAFLGQRIATESSPSDATVHLIEVEAADLLRQASAQARELLSSHQDAFNRLVDKLVEDETVARDELTELFNSVASAQ